MPAAVRVAAHRASLLFVAVALVTACTSGATPEPPPPDDASGSSSDDPAAAEGPRCPDARDRSATWVHDQEPADLLVDAVDLRAVAGWVRHGVHEGLFRRTAQGTFEPQLLVDEPDIERTEAGRTRLRFELRDDLAFSDGTALTADHVRDTYELAMSDGGQGAARLADPADYSTIDPDSWEVDDRRFAVTLDDDDAGWSTWFSRVLPTHVLPDLDTAVDALRDLDLDGSPVPSTGAMVLERWVPGEGMRFVRNDGYHGPHPDHARPGDDGRACLAALELRFVPDASALAAALRGGDADLALAPPQAELLALETTGVRVEAAPDPAVEVLLLQVAGVHLADPLVREALAAAIDRDRLIEEVHRSELGEDAPVQAHGSVLSPPGSEVDPAGEAGLGIGDVDRSEAALLEAGYDRPGDDPYTHPERGVLSVRVATPGGDRLRERQQQELQAQLRNAGWDVEVDNRDGARHLDEQLLAPDTLACAALPPSVAPGGPAADGLDCDLFDLSQVALHPSPWPVAVAERFVTGSGRDPTGLRSEVLDRVVAECRGAPAADPRPACVERLDLLLVRGDVDRRGPVVIPLVSRPHLALSGERVSRVAAASPAPDAGPLAAFADAHVGPPADDPSR